MKGARIVYSEAERAWLEEHRALPIPQYHAQFCELFGRTDVSKKNLAARRKRHGWLTGRTGRFEKGSVPRNKGVPCAPGSGGLHPNAQRTQFRQGRLPANTKYAGHERVAKDGYIEISVEQTNPHTGFERRYVRKHRWLWEQLHGPVPPGMVLKCLGERTNTDPSNFELIERALLPRLDGRSGRGFENAPAELRPTILAVAKLEHAARKRRKSGPGHACD